MIDRRRNEFWGNSRNYCLKFLAAVDLVSAVSIHVYLEDITHIAWTLPRALPDKKSVAFDVLDNPRINMKDICPSCTNLLVFNYAVHWVYSVQ